MPWRHRKSALPTLPACGFDLLRERGTGGRERGDLGLHGRALRRVGEGRKVDFNIPPRRSDCCICENGSDSKIGAEVWIGGGA